jgi:hypothetical protein
VSPARRNPRYPKRVGAGVLVGDPVFAPVASPRGSIGPPRAHPSVYYREGALSPGWRIARVRSHYFRRGTGTYRNDETHPPRIEAALIGQKSRLAQEVAGSADIDVPDKPMRVS